MLPERLNWIVLIRKSTLYTSKLLRAAMRGKNTALGTFKRLAHKLRLAIRHAVVFLACLLTLSVAQAQPDDFQSLLRNSTQAEERGDWKQAIQLCHRMLKIKPEDVATMVSLSGLYGHAENPTQQIFWSRKALTAQPKNFMALVNQGNGYSAVGEERRAMDSFRAAEAVDPSSPIPAYSMGVLAQSRERETEAVGYFRKALRLSPSFEDARFNLAVSLANLGETTQALNLLDQLLQHNPAASDAIELRVTLRNQVMRK